MRSARLTNSLWDGPPFIKLFGDLGVIGLHQSIEIVVQSTATIGRKSLEPWGWGVAQI